MITPATPLADPASMDVEAPKDNTTAAVAEEQPPAGTSEPVTTVTKPQTKTNLLGNRPYESIKTVEELEREAKFWKTKGLVEAIAKKDSNKWFLSPVDAEALELTDYHEIIKQPMDLGTILQKMEADKYDSHVDVLNDVRLTFKNAILYNAADSLVSGAAVKLLKRFEASVKKTFDKPEDMGGDVKLGTAVVSFQPVPEDLVEGKDELRCCPEFNDLALFLWLLTTGDSEFRVGAFTLEELEVALIVPQANRVISCIHTMLLLPINEVFLLRKSGFNDFERPFEWWVKELLKKLEEWNHERRELQHELNLIKTNGEDLYYPEQVDAVKVQYDLVSMLLRPLCTANDEEFEKLEQIMPFDSTESYLALSPTQRVMILRSLCEWRAAGFPEDSVLEHIRSFDVDTLRQEPIGEDNEGRSYYYYPQFYKDCRVYRSTPMPPPEQPVEVEPKVEQQEEEPQEEEEEEEEEAVIVSWRRHAKIDAVWSGDGEYYPGKIKKVNKDGSYDIRFDDGDVEAGVLASNIRARGEDKRRSPRARKQSEKYKPEEPSRKRRRSSRRTDDNSGGTFWPVERRRSGRSKSKPLRLEEEYQKELEQQQAKEIERTTKKTKKRKRKRERRVVVEAMDSGIKLHDGPELRCCKWELLCEDADGLNALIKQVKSWKNKANEDLLQELMDLARHVQEEMENIIKEKEKLERRLKKSLVPRKRSSRIAENALQKVQREEEERREQLLREERERRQHEERKRAKLREQRMLERQQKAEEEKALREANRRRTQALALRRMEKKQTADAKPSSDKDIKDHANGTLQESSQPQTASTSIPMDVTESQSTNTVHVMQQEPGDSQVVAEAKKVEVEVSLTPVVKDTTPVEQSSKVLDEVHGEEKATLEASIPVPVQMVTAQLLASVSANVSEEGSTLQTGNTPVIPEEAKASDPIVTPSSTVAVNSKEVLGMEARESSVVAETPKTIAEPIVIPNSTTNPASVAGISSDANGDQPKIEVCSVFHPETTSAIPPTCATVASGIPTEPASGETNVASALGNNVNTNHFKEGTMMVDKEDGEAGLVKGVVLKQAETLEENRSVNAGAK